MKKLLLVFLSIFTLCATPALSNDTYIGQNCEYSILQDANGAISGTIQRDSGGLFCKIQCRDGFEETETSNKKTYNLDSTNKITLKHTCEPTKPQRTSSSATTEQNDTINVQLTILDEETDEPLIGASVIAIDTTGKKISRTIGVLGGATDSNGIVQIPNVPKNAMLEISYMGYATQKISPSASETVKLTPSNTNLGEAEIIATTLINKPCEQSTILYADATSGTIKQYSKKSLYCEIQCPADRRVEKLLEPIIETTDLYNEDGNTYTLYDHCVCKDGTIEINGECKSTNNCATDQHATNSKYLPTQDRNYKCEIATCADGWKPADDKQSCVKKLTECTPEQKEQHPNASATGIKPGTEVCIATACKCGFDLKDDECVEWEKENTTSEYSKPCPTDTEPKLPKNAKSGTMQCNNGAAYCKISACNDGYNHNTDNNTCDDLNKQPCTPTDKNATSAEYRRVNGKTVCFITACSSKFNPSKDGTKCVGKNILSEADSLEKINKLQKNADEMRKIEQSTENKALGALGIGATGIGGQMLASALSEQSADTDAETAMRAYLATFHCNYGAGKNIPGGEKNIELPGGNELISLYSEYVNLANDLKVRKNALGLRPGIESEPILDSATSGLYDDVSIGKTSGAYASLARALSDPNSADAAAWAAQKSDTADKLKTGAITAGIGALGSLAGNLIINRNNPDENSRQIIAEYDLKRKIFQDLETEITDLPPAPVPPKTKCPNDANGTYPNCTCKNTKQIYIEKSNVCDTCPGDKINVNGKCDCQSPLISGDNDTCINATPSAQCTGDNMALDERTKQCVCINGYIKTDGGKSCHCPNATHHVEDSQCVKNADPAPVTPEAPQEITINLPADTLFAHGSADLTNDAQNALNTFISNLSQNGFNNCQIEIRGYTDGTGSNAFNQSLSQQRADAVKKHLTSQSNSPISSTSTATGMGEVYCNCGAGQIPTGKEKDKEYQQCVEKSPNYTNNNNLRFAPCRKVTITVNANDCKSSSTANINLLDPNYPNNPIAVKKKLINTTADDTPDLSLNNQSSDWQTLLNDLGTKLNITPSETAKSQWKTFATQCKNYNGILFISDYDSGRQLYSLACNFPDLTNTKTEIMKLYNTPNGKKYLTNQMSINEKIQFEKTDTFKNSAFGKKVIAADKRRTEMQATFYNQSPSFTADDGTIFWPTQKQSAIRHILNANNLALELPKQYRK